MNDEESDEEACPAHRPCIESHCTAMPLDGGCQHETESEEEEEAVSSSPSDDDEPPARRPCRESPCVDTWLDGNRQRKRPAGEEEEASSTEAENVIVKKKFTSCFLQVYSRNVIVKIFLHVQVYYVVLPFNSRAT